MQERRLAAIMFTDIAGYTVLMGSDEDKAFDMLKRNHIIHETLIKKHNGTLIKEVGDGTLASFPLASDAVRCAIEIQKEAKSQKIPLKIGIHEGEMVMAGVDVLGDGVNIASRLQEISTEGCITISGRVHEDVKNKAGITTKFVGDKKLKGVYDPVKVYEVLCEEEKPVASDHAPEVKKNRLLYYLFAGLVVVIAVILIWQFLPTKETGSESTEITTDVVNNSIAVLPFDNYSPDPENEYFCLGMVEEILAHLLKIEDLRVKSRTSSERYNIPDKDLKVIAKELEVAFILEGSVRKAGDDLRITAQLINGETGDHIWAETYDGKYTEKIFDFQNNVAKQVAFSLNAIITPEEEERIESTPTTNIAAYDFYLKGKEISKKYWGIRDYKYLNIAHDLLDRALEIDPYFLDALSTKGGVFMAEGKYDSALSYVNRVIALDPENWRGYQTKGDISHLTGEYDSAIEYYSMAISLSPKDKFIWACYGLVRTYLQGKNDPVTGLQIAKNLPLEIGPESDIYQAIGECFRFIGDYKHAEEYFRKRVALRTDCKGIGSYVGVLALQSKHLEALLFLDSICGKRPCLEECYRNKFVVNLMRKEIEKAQNNYNQLVEAGMTLPLTANVWLAYMYQELGQEQEALTILNNIRIRIENLFPRNRYVSYRSLYLAAIHALLDEKEEAFMFLSDAVEIGLSPSWHDYLEINPLFAKLHNDPEFKAIVKRAKEEKAALRAQVREMIESGEIDL